LLGGASDRARHRLGGCMRQGYAVAGIEPPLEELLEDQIARLIMRRDGIEPADV
jgi:hypothetical protein